MDKIKNTLVLLRPKHWIKNALCFLPVIFSGQFMDMNILFINIIGGIAFCLASSMIYVYNDMKDVEKDKIHPTKSQRPLAAGKVSISEAIIIEIILVVFLGLFVSVLLEYKLVIVILMSFIVMNLIYSNGLKNRPIFDVFCISMGYVLRLYSGGALSNAPISNWMFITVFSASMYLAFGKRRNEILTIGYQSRQSLKLYSQNFLDSMVNIFLTLIIVFYSLSCSDDNTWLAQNNYKFIWTIPIIIFIFLRYHMNLVADKSSGDPIDLFLRDKVLMLASSMYILSVVLYVYII